MSSAGPTPCLSRDNSRASGGGGGGGGGGTGATTIQHSMLVQTSFDSKLPGGELFIA